MKAKVYDQQGKEAGQTELSSNIFEIKPKEVLLKQAVIRYLASLRRPIAKTKTRAERRGGGRKPWRQKGTGRARVGSRRSPIWRKGGVVFGPTGNENFTKAMPKKAVKKSILMALSAQAEEGRIVIVEEIKFTKPQTKKFFEVLKKLPVSGKILLILGKDPILLKSASNMPNVYPLVFDQLSAYNILVADYVVILKEVISQIGKIYGKDLKGSAKEEKPVVKEAKTKKAGDNPAFNNLSTGPRPRQRNNVARTRK